MKFPPQKKLSVADERQLDQWLCAATTPEGTFNVNQLKGFLFCVCTTPLLLPPSDWLPEIFGGDLINLTDTAIESAMPLIMQLYNQINQEVLDDESVSPASNCTFDSSCISNNFQPGNQLHDWCYGFESGLQLTFEYWDHLALADTDLEEVIENFQVALCFFADEDHTRECLGKGVNKEEVFVDMAQTIYQNLPLITREYAEICRELYLTSPHSGRANLRVNAGASDIDELIEAAHQAEDPEEAVQIAKQALDLDPDCVDAFILLAELDAHNNQEKINFLELAVAAGEKTLGSELLDQYAGELWMLYEARPYLQALHFLADTYRSAGKTKEALAAFEKCLVLNTNDNQGIRHTLVGVYIEQHEMRKARELLDTYAEDLSAFMIYNRALLSYIQEGDSQNSRELKAAAKKHNKHVPKLLGDKIKMPDELPLHHGFGDKNEAVLYVHDHKNIWRSALGSIAWLAK